MSYSSEKVFFTLKHILKAKSISYRSLGKSLNISEAGVKKMFQARDCSLSRISEICQIVEIPIADLFESVGSRSVREIEMSAAQSSFFSEHPEYFRFYEKLAFERRSVSEIQRTHRLTEKSVRKYLRKLEELKLLEVHSKDRIKLEVSRLSKVKIGNPKLKELRLESISRFLRGIKSGTENHTLGTVHFKLKGSTLKKFQADLMELTERYFVQSEFEQSVLQTRDLEELNMVIGAAPHSLVGEIGNV